MTTFFVLLLGIPIGLAVGAFGGGGSVLTVPILVTLLNVEAHDAITTSLVVVGVAALSGVLRRLSTKEIDIRRGLAFAALAIPGSVLGTAANRRLNPHVLLLVFGLFIAIVALRMWQSAQRAEAASEMSSRRRAVLVTVAGLGTGVLTGLLGVGGGFIIVPVFYLVLRTSMGTAVGSSLLVIVLNASLALALRFPHPGIVWSLAVPLAATGLIGSLIGTSLSRKASGESVVRGFAILLAVVSVGTSIQASWQLFS
ncbi:MAG: sulfite exporter TauE/SafE family protein [Actinomycetes bacterium]